ncbi:hypothetical protein ABQF34_07250 [Mycolicibacterium boenickei]
MSSRPRQVPVWHLDPADRFDAYVERSTNYFAAVEATGDMPWFADDGRRAEVAQLLGADGATGLRRALFNRRFTKPAPPAGLFVNPAQIRGRAA